MSQEQESNLHFRVVALPTEAYWAINPRGFEPLTHNYWLAYPIATTAIQIVYYSALLCFWYINLVCLQKV